MSQPTTSIFLSSTTPNASPGFQNAVFASDNGSPAQTVSVAVPQTGNVNQQTANYTLQSSDCGKLVVVNSAVAVTVTLPETIPFTQWTCGISSIGTGTTTITPGNLHLDGTTANVALAQGQGLQIATNGTNYFSERGIAGAKLETNGTLNASQAGLNLIAGDNVTLTNTANGNVVIASTGGGGGGNVVGGIPMYIDGNVLLGNAGVQAVTFSTNGISNYSNANLNLVAGNNITITNTVSGNVTISATGISSTGVFTKNVVTSSRAFNTVYQNTTGFPMVVIGYDTTTGGSVICYSDSNSSPTTEVWNFESYGGVNGAFYCVVMPNDYYEIVGSTLGAWTEFVANTGSATDSGNIAGSRAYSTTYQNSTSGMMLVQVVASGTSNGDEMTVTSDSTSAPSSVIWDQATPINYNSAFFLVPQGYYYSVAGTGTILTWREVSFSFGAIRSNVSGERSTNRSVALSSAQNQSGKSLFTVVAGINSGSTGTFIMTAFNVAAASFNQMVCASFSGGRVKSMVVIAEPLDFVSAYQDSDATPGGSQTWFEYAMG